MAAASSSTSPQVFINFRGSDMRLGFLGFLVTSMRNANMKVFTDKDEFMGSSLQNLLVRIEESRVALAIFSMDYSSSKMCLDELVKMKECMDQGSLTVIPVFYKIEPSMVKHLEGHFGDAFRALKRKHRHEPERAQKWEEALKAIPRILGSRLSEKSDWSDEDFIKMIVEGVQRTLSNISMKENPSKELKAQGETRGKETREAKDEVGLMVTARQLEISYSQSPEKWTWSSIYEEPNSAGIEIATMIKLHSLKIVGKFTRSDLTPGKEYEVVFVVKLEGTASGWQCPVNLKLKLEQQGGSGGVAVNLTKYIGHGWVNIRAGVFVAPPKNAVAKGTVTMSQYDDDRKDGLVIKGVAILPTN